MFVAGSALSLLKPREDPLAMVARQMRGRTGEENRVPKG
jgi:hypothetical protein